VRHAQSEDVAVAFFVFVDFVLLLSEDTDDLDSEDLESDDFESDDSDDFDFDDALLPRLSFL